MITHPIPPVFDSNSKILILGSFPSVKSRETAFFYGHPSNRFWRVISGITGCPLPSSVEEKRDLLLQAGIAVWDVIASCEIKGSADSSIGDVIPNDLTTILSKSKINQIFVNGKTAEKYYNKYIKYQLDISAICLPSTSPANAAWSTEHLISEWSIIREYL